MHFFCGVNIIVLLKVISHCKYGTFFCQHIDRTYFVSWNLMFVQSLFWNRRIILKFNILTKEIDCWWPQYSIICTFTYFQGTFICLKRNSTFDIRKVNNCRKEWCMCVTKVKFNFCLSFVTGSTGHFSFPRGENWNCIVYFIDIFFYRKCNGNS